MAHFLEIRSISQIFEVCERKTLFGLRGQKKYIHALNDVSLNIKKGELFGLLGPNGAGKTTLIKIICGLLNPTNGQILMDGHSPRKSLSRLGVMFGPTLIYHRMTGYDNLEYFARLYYVKDRQSKIRKGSIPFLVEIEKKLPSFMLR